MTGAVQTISFRLNGKMYASSACICLYRAVDAESLTAQYLMMTKAGVFAYLELVIGGKGLYTATEWSPDRAMRYLLEHGEGDVVNEFPDIFRKRPATAPVVKEKTVAGAPKNRPTEPYLFPLQ
jgi:hypothetical protein